jgi:hypothetical protein
MAEARCPVCGRLFKVPAGPGRAMVETRFLGHKDGCRVPVAGEFVRVQGYVALVEQVDDGSEEYPLLTVRYPSGRESVLRAAVVYAIEDQEAARERFFG